MIGIIGAMPEEVAAIQEKMEEVQIRRVAGLDFVQGSLMGKDAAVVCCGVGKVNAAMWRPAITITMCPLWDLWTVP